MIIDDLYIPVCISTLFTLSHFFILYRVFHNVSLNSFTYMETVSELFIGKELFWFKETFYLFSRSFERIGCMNDVRRNIHGKIRADSSCRNCPGQWQCRRFPRSRQRFRLLHENVRPGAYRARLASVIKDEGRCYCINFS